MVSVLNDDLLWPNMFSVFIEENQNKITIYQKHKDTFRNVTIDNIPIVNGSIWQ